jgi:hypothetical protein
VTGSAFRAVAPVSAVCAAFAAQSSAYPPSTRKPDVAPVCGSAANTKKEIKMSTEFYCEEFPTEQNGKPVQTLKDLLEAYPEDRFHFMTPFGYVDLNAQDAEQLRQGTAMPAHAGESGWEIPIPAEKLLQQELVSVRKAENGQWYAITTDPQPEMVEMEQIQEMQL